MTIVDKWGNPYRIMHAAQQSTRRGPVYELPIDDFDKLVPSYDRQTLMSISNRVFLNFGIVKAAIRQKAYYSIGDAWLPRYIGTQDNDTGKRVADFLRNVWLPNCEVRGGLFDWWKMWDLASQAIDRDGDVFLLQVLGADGFPRVQMVPAHRCKSDPLGSQTITAGVYSGLIITDGIIHQRDGRVWAYRFNLGDSGTNDKVYDVPASSVIHLFDPTHITQKRGLPGFAHALEEIKAVIGSHADERQRQMIVSRLHLLLFNPDGAPDDSFGPSTTSSNGDVTQREFAGGIYYLPTDGSKIEQLKHENPGVVWESFQDRLIKIALAGFDWTPSLLIDHAGQGTGERTEIMKARKAIANRQSLIFFAARRLTAWAAQVFASQGRVPFVEAPSAWDFSHPPRLSVDDGRESRIELEELKSGSRNLSEVLDARGVDEDEFVMARAWSIAKRKAISALVSAEASKKYGVEIEIDPSEMSAELLPDEPDDPSQPEPPDEPDPD